MVFIRFTHVDDDTPEHPQVLVMCKKHYSEAKARGFDVKQVTRQKVGPCDWCT